MAMIKSIGIIGNSQAGGAGTILKNRLESRGYKVSREYKDGSGSEDLYRQWSKISGKNQIDALFVMCGSSKLSGITELIDSVGGIPVIWYGSSPATRIMNVQMARTKFGSKVSGEFYWFENGEAAAREKRAVELAEILAKYPNVKNIEYRDLTLNHSVMQKSGVFFPDQPDGIHISNATAGEIFSEESISNALSDWSGSDWSDSGKTGGLSFGWIALGIGTLIGGVVYAARRWR